MERVPCGLAPGPGEGLSVLPRHFEPPEAPLPVKGSSDSAPSKAGTSA